MLNEEEKAMVEANLSLIPGVIHRFISTNESIPGLEYNDLYQDACAALCKAAKTYTGQVAFSTYARIVIKNYLISQCRTAVTRYSHECPPDDWEKWQMSLEDIPAPAESGQELEESLAKIEGCTTAEKQGIKALIWRAQGYSCREIGKLYSFTDKLASNRISLARKKIRSCPELLSNNIIEKKG